MSSIRRKMVFASGITILAFAAVSATVSWTTRDLIATHAALDESERRIAQANRVERLLVDLTMSEVAFTATGDEKLLAPYKAANEEIHRAIEGFGTTVADEPEQAQRVHTVGSLVKRWLTETAEPVIAAKRQAMAAARVGNGATPGSESPRLEDDVLQQAGNTRIGAVRKELDSFNAREESNVRERQAASAESARLAAYVSIGGGAFAILIAVVSASLALRAVTRPLAELVEATERIKQGELTERVPVRAQDEVGALAEAFNAMAESITTSRREVEERARTLTAVLDHVDVGIALLDASGKARLVNSRLPKVLQVATFEIEEAGGLLGWIRKHATRPEQVESWQTQIARNPACLIYETVELGPPRNLVLRVYGGPIGAPILGPILPPKGTVGAPLPPRAQVAAGARILVLRDATREAEADRVKTEFISTVSHELRTPLTSVRGYIDLIISGDAGPVSEQQREFLEIVQRNGERLSGLINDLLDVEKLQAGKIPLKKDPVDLGRVIESVVKTFRVTAQQKGVALESLLDPVPSILGDEDRLTQVFANLVSNAIKYTKEGTVLARVLRVGMEIKVEVRDTGIGLTAEERGRIFERFFRADNTYTRSVGGTGLGLAIAKAIVERHGAKIEVSSEPGRGSTFTVSFPLNPAVDQPGGPAPSNGAGAEIKPAAPSVARV